MVCSETAVQFLICELHFLLLLCPSFKQIAFLNISSVAAVAYLFSPLRWQWISNNTAFRSGLLTKILFIKINGRYGNVFGNGIFHRELHIQFQSSYLMNMTQSEYDYLKA